MKSIITLMIGLSVSISSFAGGTEIILRNDSDLKWEAMLPELGENSPMFAILRIDAKTKATTLRIRFPRAIHIPRHTHEKSETHILLGGTHVFEQDGKRYEVKENGYLYMPGKFVHEAWVPKGAEAIIILEDGWKVDWVKEGPDLHSLDVKP